MPPPVPEMKAALGDFERFLHMPSDWPPLARLGLVHSQFEAIHPFLDGNGRIGRLLIALLLCVEGLRPEPLLYLSLLFARPVLTMPQIAEALGVNYATATRYLRRLQEAALLREITGQARNPVYRADEVVAAIEEPLSPEGEA